MVTKLLHTRYRVADLDKTIAFYTDVLGLREIRRHKSPRGSELVFLQTPRERGACWKSAATRPAGRSWSAPT